MKYEAVQNGELVYFKFVSCMSQGNTWWV